MARRPPRAKRPANLRAVRRTRRQFHRRKRRARILSPAWKPRKRKHHHRLHRHREMKLLALATCLCPVLAVAAGTPQPAGPWQIAPEPAGKTGLLGSWDDWSVATPSIIKIHEKWWLLFARAA